ncbi:S1 family peptidase [Vibrio ziniensis]|uniref:Serine protease n=1 Tax=Vibrio ziniensis TaxID=2711221 RepID=A0A6G7CQI4_9VIBR|nr:serine protease [Vibrio ziniensis]QIH44350.1 serine protease [Vibrio ziniensis]
MNSKTILLAILIGITFQSSADEDHQAFIVNGSYADTTAFPSYVALFVDLLAYNNTYYKGSYCGGTILNSTHILTAAHCVYSTNPDSSLYTLFTTVVPNLQYESDFPYGITEKKRVAKIYYPDSFNRSTLDNDLAILQLESALKTISSINYAVRPDSGSVYRASEIEFYAVGHGNTETGEDNVDSLQKASLYYVSNSACKYKNMSDSKLCMSGNIDALNGLEASTCQGDSGGPLFWYYGGEYIQVGVTSYGPASFCGDSNYSATSVFTEIYDYNDWINSVLAGSTAEKFVATEAKREAYIANPPSSTDTGSSNTDTGGLLSVLALFWLLLITFFRKACC